MPFLSSHSTHCVARTIALCVATVCLSTAHAQTGGVVVERVITLREPTAAETKTLARSPAKELAASAFQLASVDLNDDGIEELLIVSRSSDYCGSGGCTTVVLRRSKDGWTLLELSNSTLFGETGEFGLLKDKKSGYRLLALTSGGTVVLGDRRGTPTYRKPMVTYVIVPKS